MLFVVKLFFAFTSYIDVKFPRIVDRIPVPLILNGQIIKDNLNRVTAVDLQLSAPNSPAPVVVINDCHIVEENIQKLGHSRESFLILFSAQCAYAPEQIYLATLDKAGSLYFSEYTTLV